MGGPPLSQEDMDSYCNYYSKILKNYQYNENKNIKYETSCLVTDSDSKSL